MYQLESTAHRRLLVTALTPPQTDAAHEHIPVHTIFRLILLLLFLLLFLLLRLLLLQLTSCATEFDDVCMNDAATGKLQELVIKHTQQISKLCLNSGGGSRRCCVMCDV
jgi:hypothetical protein